MLCPLKFAKEVNDKTLWKCEQDKCAWWENRGGRCCMHNLIYLQCLEEEEEDDVFDYPDNEKR